MEKETRAGGGGNWLNQVHNDDDDARLTAIVEDNPGKPVPECLILYFIGA